jgi:hypothetical protein
MFLQQLRDPPGLVRLDMGAKVIEATPRGKRLELVAHRLNVALHSGSKDEEPGCPQPLQAPDRVVIRVEDQAILH